MASVSSIPMEFALNVLKSSSFSVKFVSPTLLVVYSTVERTARLADQAIPLRMASVSLGTSRESDCLVSTTSTTSPLLPLM
jgi:hypothetical protein